MNAFSKYFLGCMLLLFISSCLPDEGLTELEQDIVDEWLVDNYVYTGNDLANDGTIFDMIWLFDSNFNVEISWFEGPDFRVVDGTWRVNEFDAYMDIDLDENVFFFCDDDELTLDLFFFAGDLELTTECGSNDWLEIQLERI